MGPDGQHRVGALEQHGDPAGAVVGPLRVDDLGPRDAEGARDLAERPSSTGPERSSGGAANASPASVRRTRTSPAPHSCTTILRRAVAPASSQAWQVPSVGCPANGSSTAGVKMRTR